MIFALDNEFLLKALFFPALKSPWRHPVNLPSDWKSTKEMPSPLAQKIVNLQEIFNLFDKSGNDSVDRNKMGHLLRSAGLNPTEQAIQSIQSKQEKMKSPGHWCAPLEKLHQETVSFSQFNQIYQEFLENDLSHDLSLSSISKSPSGHEPTLQSMINAIRTFDHQGTGFISQAELQFSNRHVNAYLI